ncbi:hypothetical protein HDV00_010331 [Rhizophlyctis rosea]|nr:hypothetical protein HDV00_010331 [Rhizophlyctis rosea]
MPKTLIIVTGASRGFGHILSTLLASSSLSTTNTTIILTSRTSSSLSALSSTLRSLPTSPTVIPLPTDFSLPDVDASTSTIISAIPPAKYDIVYLFNNAGSLGKLQRIRDRSCEDIEREMRVNVTAPMVLTSKVLRKYADDATKTVIVNVSSLAAIQPFDCWGIYATGKAARDMFHRNIAIEEHERQKEQNSASSTPRVRVLNYAPGPMDTAMQTEIRDTMPDIPLRKIYVDMHNEGKLVKPEDSARVLVKLLEEDTWENGAHLDYFDLVSAGKCV